jgi:hypothetical protein
MASSGRVAGSLEVVLAEVDQTRAIGTLAGQLAERDDTARLALADGLERWKQACERARR